MSGRKPWIFAGITAVAVAGGLLVMRAGSSSRAPSPASSEGASGGSGGATAPRQLPTPEPRRKIPDRPPVAEVRSGPASQDREQGASFEDEPRDDAWAPVAEAEIAARARATGVELTAIECRHRQCRLVIEGADEAALGLALGKLESSSGLAGYADQMVISVPQPGGAGLQMQAYAQFER